MTVALIRDRGLPRLQDFCRRLAALRGWLELRLALSIVL
jgi:hypothetical protein